MRCLTFIKQEINHPYSMSYTTCPWTNFTCCQWWKDKTGHPLINCSRFSVWGNILALSSSQAPSVRTWSGPSPRWCLECLQRCCLPEQSDCRLWLAILTSLLPQPTAMHVSGFILTSHARSIQLQASVAGFAWGLHFRPVSTRLQHRISWLHHQSHRFGFILTRN